MPSATAASTPKTRRAANTIYRQNCIISPESASEPAIVDLQSPQHGVRMVKSLVNGSLSHSFRSELSPLLCLAEMPRVV